MRANVTQEERDFVSEYQKQSEQPQGEAHWSEGLGICDPRDYKLDSYNTEPKSQKPKVLVDPWQWPWATWGLKKPHCQTSMTARWQTYI